MFQENSCEISIFLQLVVLVLALFYILFVLCIAQYFHLYDNYHIFDCSLIKIYIFMTEKKNSILEMEEKVKK